MPLHADAMLLLAVLPAVADGWWDNGHMLVAPRQSVYSFTTFPDETTWELCAGLSQQPRAFSLRCSTSSPSKAEVARQQLTSEQVDKINGILQAGLQFAVSRIPQMASSNKSSVRELGVHGRQQVLKR